MSDSKPIVYIVDDSENNLSLVSSYLADTEYRVQPYLRGAELIASCPLQGPGCILLDNMMPELSGLEVQRELLEKHRELPIIFMSGESSYEDVFDATQKGAFAFLQKPLRRDKLLELVQRALAKSEEMLAKRENDQEVLLLYNKLTKREKQIFHLLAEGKPNKMISNTLGIALRTVEFHRANIQSKLKANLLADLIDISKKLQG